MFTYHAIIVLTENINTCVFCKHKRVPSKPLVKLACWLIYDHGFLIMNIEMLLTTGSYH